MGKKVGGHAQRAHLRSLVARGKQPASVLRGPTCPESLRYLYGWARELHGRSGVTQFGLAPLTYGTIESWSRLTGRTVSPTEVIALMQLDGAMLFPGEATNDG